LRGNQGKLRQKKRLKRVLKTDIDDADVTLCVIAVFHSREVATGKARSPMVEKTGASDDKR